MLLLKCYSLCFTYILYQQHGPGYFSGYSDSLLAWRSGDRISFRATFSTPVQTGIGAYPASCTMGTGSVSVVNWPGRFADHPLPSKCRRREMIGLYLYSIFGPKCPVTGRTAVPTVGICYTGSIHCIYLNKFPCRCSVQFWIIQRPTFQVESVSEDKQ